MGHELKKIWNVGKSGKHRAVCPGNSELGYCQDQRKFERQKESSGPPSVDITTARAQIGDKQPGIRIETGVKELRITREMRD